MTSEPQPATKPPRRRRPRFTLRVLLVVVTLLCIGLGWWTHRAREQRRIVERIHATGGHVNYDYLGDPFSEGPRSRVPAWLLDSLGPDFFHQVIAVSMPKSSSLTELRQFRNLERLEIQCDSLSDAELDSLMHLRSLWELKIEIPEVDGRAKIGDHSMQCISELPELRRATIGSVHVTAKGLKALSQSPSLQMLHITCDEADVNEHALEALRKNGNIESFRVGWQSHDRWYQIAEWSWPKH